MSGKKCYIVVKHHETGDWMVQPGVITGEAFLMYEVKMANQAGLWVSAWFKKAFVSLCQ